MARTKGIAIKEDDNLYYDEEGRLRRFVSAIALPRLRVFFDKEHRHVCEITMRIDATPEELTALIDWMRRPPVWVTFSKVQLELPEPVADERR